MNDFQAPPQYDQAMATYMKVSISFKGMDPHLEVDLYNEQTYIISEEYDMRNIIEDSSLIDRHFRGPGTAAAVAAIINKVLAYFDDMEFICCKVLPTSKLPEYGNYNTIHISLKKGHQRSVTHKPTFNTIYVAIDWSTIYNDRVSSGREYVEIYQ